MFDQEYGTSRIEFKHTYFINKCHCCLVCSQDVKPGKARVVKCLIENMAQPNFGEDCKEELQQRDEIMKSDIRCVCYCLVHVCVKSDRFPLLEIAPPRFSSLQLG